MMTCCNFPLPEVLLFVSGDVFEARSPEGYRPLWHIRAEAETATAARTLISLDARIVANVTIHAAHESQLPDEVQAVAAALLWSALRATTEPWRGLGPELPPEHDPDRPPCDQCGERKPVETITGSGTSFYICADCKRTA